jgi:hypothetical protein
MAPYVYCPTQLYLRSSAGSCQHVLRFVHSCIIRAASLRARRSPMRECSWRVGPGPPLASRRAAVRHVSACGIVALPPTSAPAAVKPLWLRTAHSHLTKLPCGLEQGGANANPGKPRMSCLLHAVVKPDVGNRRRICVRHPLRCQGGRAVGRSGRPIAPETQWPRSTGQSGAAGSRLSPADVRVPVHLLQWRRPGFRKPR